MDDLQGPEAALADVARVDGVRRVAFLATERLDRHQKPPPGTRGGGRWGPRPHLTGIGTFPLAGGLPGFHRASPSTPLDASSYVQPEYTRTRRYISPHAEPPPSAPTPGTGGGPAAGPRGPQRGGRGGPRPALDQHPAPPAGRPRVAGGALRLPPVGLRRRLLAQPAAEDRRVRRVPVHRPALRQVRQAGRAPQRGRAGHLRRQRLRHHPAQRRPAAAGLPLRAGAHAGGPARPALRQGAGLPALQDRRRLGRRVVPHASQGRQQARAPGGRDLRGPRRGHRARPLQRQAGDHQLPQDRASSAHGAARPRADQAEGLRRGARRLLRRHRRRLRAHLGHARELQGGRRGAGVDQRIGDLPPRQRHPARADGHLRRGPAAHPGGQHLGDERQGAVGGPGRGLRRRRGGDGADALRHAGLLPPPPLAVTAPLRPAELSGGAERRHFGLDGSLQVVAALVVINVAVFLVSLATAGSLTNTTGSSLVTDGGLFGPAVESGQWWRIYTSGFEHASWGHLVSNLIALIGLGLLLGNAIGPVRLLLVYVASLVGGSLLALIFSGDALTVGASGAIFGLAGAAVVVAWEQRRWALLILAGGWAAANLVFTVTTPGVSVAGHLGGLLAGGLLGRWFVAGPDRLRADAASVVIGLATVAAL